MNEEVKKLFITVRLKINREKPVANCTYFKCEYSDIICAQGYKYLGFTENASIIFIKGAFDNYRTKFL